jgi:hypothetical protein
MTAVRRPKIDDKMAMMLAEYKANPKKFPGGKKQAQAIAYSKAGVQRRQPHQG